MLYDKLKLIGLWFSETEATKLSMLDKMYRYNFSYESIVLFRKRISMFLGFEGDPTNYISVLYFVLYILKNTQDQPLHHAIKVLLLREYSKLIEGPGFSHLSELDYITETNPLLAPGNNPWAYTYRVYTPKYYTGESQREIAYKRFVEIVVENVYSLRSYNKAEILNRIRYISTYFQISYITLLWAITTISNYISSHTFRNSQEQEQSEGITMIDEYVNDRVTTLSVEDYSLLEKKIINMPNIINYREMYLDSIRSNKVMPELYKNIKELIPKELMNINWNSLVTIVQKLLKIYKIMRNKKPIEIAGRDVILWAIPNGILLLTRNDSWNAIMITRDGYKIRYSTTGNCACGERMIGNDRVISPVNNHSMIHNAFKCPSCGEYTLLYPIAFMNGCEIRPNI